MRLYLSSFDVGNCPDELVALAGEARRAAIILNALDHRPQARTGWLERQTSKLVELGFSVVELESVDREIAFYEESGIPYRTLRDGEAMVINGEHQKIVGSRD